MLSNSYNEISLFAFLSFCFIGYFIFLNILVTKQKRVKFQKREFTQRHIDQNKEIPILISKMIKNEILTRHPSFFQKNALSDVESMSDDELYRIFRFFNSLADGIDSGIYDEILLRTNYEEDIKIFYRYSGPFLRKLRAVVDSDEMILPIEFLLKNWETKNKKKKVKILG